MWVIVAMSLAFGDSPKLTIMPGPEYQTKEDCLKAVHLHADFESEKGGVQFSICVPKDSVQIGRSSADNGKQE
jgi:hypothetical protein